MNQSRDELQRIKDDRVVRAMADFRDHGGGVAPARLRKEYEDVMRRRGRPVDE